jgi:hypothetical protein
VLLVAHILKKNGANKLTQSRNLGVSDLTKKPLALAVTQLNMLLIIFGPVKFGPLEKNIGYHHSLLPESGTYAGCKHLGRSVRLSSTVSARVLLTLRV